MAILVFQHDATNTAGRLGVTLRDHGLRIDVRQLFRGDAVPPDLDGVEGIVSLGGRPNVDDPREDHPWMDEELSLLREGHERGIPVVGVCLGHQMIAAALGGTVERSAKQAFGFLPLSIGPAGHTDEVLSGVAWDSPQFYCNTREVTALPPGAVTLASTPRCKNSIVRFGARTYGFQHHFELDREGVARFVREGKQSFYDNGLTFDDVNRQAERDYPMFARLSDRVCVNLVTYLFVPDFVRRV
ncbi:MAG: type 1 glutamine amidotransferase [Phycisphaeraceae bacterium]|nr:type 1 glutamine amidotransferase [Phycisphaeraceae bacterium]